MRVRSIIFAALILGLTPATAAADYPHVVQKGETLTSVAATDGLSVSALAAANHISTTAELVAGQVLEIPPLTNATTTATVSTQTSATHAVSQRPVSYTTTSSGGTSISTTTTTTTVNRTASTSAPPYPTDERVSEAEIGAIAEANGVPPALAEAIAWQESGWNNDEVSDVGAVGVMQIVPSTWSWIDTYLTPSDPLGVASAAENVRGGVLLLHQLLTLTGGNQSLAIAGYYQGLSSVQKYGMYSSTRLYVADVLSLEARL